MTELGHYLLLHWKGALGWLWLLAGIYLAARVVLLRRSPAATLAWILVLSLISPLGLVLYHFIGPQRVKRQTLRRIRSRALLASANDLDTVKGNTPEPSVWVMQHSRLIEASSGIPPSSCVEINLLNGGAATLDAILQAVEQASHHIHFEYYIFEPDHTGARLLHTLCAKAKAGVKVRLLVDGVGSARLLGWRGRSLRAAFAAAGGELYVFHPARLVRLKQLVNLRTHRKIVVCDGVVGFTGGINITDDENERIRPKRAYRDTHLRLEGAGVRWLQYVFLQDWAYVTGQHQFEPGILAPDAPAGNVPMHVVASGPDSEGQAIHHSMVHAINIAEDRILLTTPYFVPTEPAWFALMNAARRGVNVQVMVPSRSDSYMVTMAARSYYPSLRDAGVKIFEYQGRMLHAKTLVVDESYSLVGTANFDNRSLLLNFEIAVALYNAPLAQALAQMFENDLHQCRFVTAEMLHEPWPRRALVAVARLLSPLL